MVRSRLSVPYSKVEATLYTSITGEIVYEDIDEVYRRYEVRDKVIIRVDLTNQLTEDILCKNANFHLKRDYLSVVFGLIENKNQMSEVLKKVYLNDDTFKMFLANICYFELPKFKNYSLLQYLVVNNKLKRNKAIDDFWNNSVITSSKTSILSTWYLYICVNDKADSVCNIPEEFKVEAISYAKKWNCVYPRAVR